MSDLLLTVALLLGNGFFVASEFSLIASRRTVIEPMAATSRRARTALRAMNEIPLMIAGAQLGVTICSSAWARWPSPPSRTGCRARSRRCTCRSS
ncbi:hypothetical protein GCM10027610_121210 [Dactylosporangium cerinum]